MEQFEMKEKGVRRIKNKFIKMSCQFFLFLFHRFSPLPLWRQAEVEFEDEEVDVEGDADDQYEEYEWCGQTRVRATQMLRAEGQLHGECGRASEGEGGRGRRQMEGELFCDFSKKQKAE